MKTSKEFPRLCIALDRQVNRIAFVQVGGNFL